MTPTDGKKLSDNRKARFLYSIEDTLMVGMVLVGSEVKSMKANNFNFNDAYVTIENDEFWLSGLHIAPFKQAVLNPHAPLRKRKLLAHKEEILKFKKKVSEKGYALIPLGVYLQGGLLKMEIALGKGKKLHDKRETIKARDAQRDTQRELRRT